VSNEGTKDQLVLGIDAGTQGVRALVAGPDGQIVATASVGFGFRGESGPEGWAEQNPTDWWAATVECVRAALRQLGSVARSSREIAALSVVSTSGTIVAVDDQGRPLRPAILYHDNRAAREAGEVAQAGAELAAQLGHQFNASFGLPKILWIKRHEPAVFASARFIHAADFIVGRLTGRYDVTDHTNALKSGGGDGDGLFKSTQTRLRKLLAQRDALATQIKNGLFEAAFENTALAGPGSQLARCQALRERAGELATGD